jgi:hemerythrin
MPLTWSTSHAVFVPEIDDEHKAIFEAVAALQNAISSPAPPAEIRKSIERLTDCIAEHFAHEERLMRAARYGSIRWHQLQHRHARRRVEQFVLQIEQGDSNAAPELVKYLTSWLPYHARLADRMMGAFLRNRQRAMWKVTFQAGTKPIDACEWVDTRGEKFQPLGE